LLLTEEGLGPTTVCAMVGSLKDFAAWMLSRPAAITRYRYVTPSVLCDYFDHFSKRPARGSRKNTTVSNDTMQHTLRSITKLYKYGDRLEDALQTTLADWLFNQLPKQYQIHTSSAARTLPIPDEQHRVLLGAALNFINEKADKTISSLKAFVKEEKILQIKDAQELKPIGEVARRRIERVARRIKRTIPKFTRQDSNGSKIITSLSAISLAREANVPLNFCVACLERDSELRRLFRARRRFLGDNIHWDCGELNTNLRLLQMSCFIIIATSTGMRLSELLALKPGCIVQRKIKGSKVFLYWLKSVLVKTSPRFGGEINHWLCGELSARAIRVLEQLHAILPSTIKPREKIEVPLEDSLFRAYTWTGILIEARSMCAGAIYNGLKFAIKELTHDVGHVHPHQFRRTFARNVVRWSTVPILALQRHFKHWSLLMTDYYIGVDDELMRMFFYEQREASRGRLRQILQGECGGPGGIISQKRLMKMVDQEELPVNFRGKEHFGTIENLLNDLCEDGISAYKCGEFTTCLYVPGVAKCGEDGPKEHECHPTECVNSHILVEDVPFYLNNIRQNQLLYDQLTAIEKVGPFGFFLLERIRRDKVAIKPLAILYKEKLGGLKSYYENLTETEQVNTYGLILKNRIELDSATLEYLF
jgi:integrase